MDNYENMDIDKTTKSAESIKILSIQNKRRPFITDYGILIFQRWCHVTLLKRKVRKTF